jgi:hypothetical protein
MSTSSEVERDRANAARSRPVGPGAVQQGAEPAAPPVIPPPGEEDEAPVDEGEPPDEPPDDQVDDEVGDDEPPEPPSGPAIVQLQPTKPVYAVGERVVVQVVVDGARNVGSAPFHLRYNPGVLHYRSPGTEGPFLRGDGTNTVFLSSDTGGGGEIVVGLSRMGAATGASGSGTLAIFEFDAVAPGDCGFQFTGASVKDPQARNLPAAFQTAVVRVQ